MMYSYVRTISIFLKVKKRAYIFSFNKTTDTPVYTSLSCYGKVGTGGRRECCLKEKEKGEKIRSRKKRRVFKAEREVDRFLTFLIVFPI